MKYNIIRSHNKIEIHNNHLDYIYNNMSIHENLLTEAMTESMIEIQNYMDDIPRMVETTENINKTIDTVTDRLGDYLFDIEDHIHDITYCEFTSTGGDLTKKQLLTDLNKFMIQVKRIRSAVAGAEYTPAFASDPIMAVLMNVKLVNKKKTTKKY